MSPAVSSNAASPSGVTRTPRSCLWSIPRSTSSSVAAATLAAGYIDARSSLLSAYARSAAISIPSSDSTTLLMSRNLPPARGAGNGEHDGRKPDRHAMNTMNQDVTAG